MEETSSNLLALPRRSYNQPVKFSARSEKTCITNYFGIDLGGKMSQVYQYSFDCEPALPQDSKDLLREVIKSIKSRSRTRLK
jgi:hypothetical protein